MIDTKINAKRGRPRRFDPEQALETAQALFHRHGYDAVSMAMLTDALGINPPSFYAAFGNKADLFNQVLRRYAADSGLPIEDCLRADRPVAQGLGALLMAAAELYARDPARPGCMVMEASRDDMQQTARGLRRESWDAIRAFVAARHPADADRLADFMLVTMTGLSAAAKSGMDAQALAHAAAIAAKGIGAELVE